MQIQENKSLKPYHSFHMDVNSAYFIEITNEKSLLELLRSDVLKIHRHLIVGSGCNMLFANDFNGLFVKLAMRGIQIESENDKHVYIRAAAGEDWRQFVFYCLNQGAYGIENLAHIPGTVGAAPVQNIGAYGVELKDIIESVEVVNKRSCEKQSLTKQACRFGYRDSIFKNEWKDQYIITSVLFKLNKTPTLNTEYGAIASLLAQRGISEATPLDVAEVVIALRDEKLPDPDKVGNAGSFFKNPVVSTSKFEALKEKFPDIVSFPQKSEVKISAGWLIEKAGWKGSRIGDAAVYDKQALILVNYGNASGTDVLTLAYDIIASVENKFQITLEPEVNIIRS